MDLRDLSGEAEAFQPADEELRGVAMLGEDDELLVDVLRISEDLAKLLELGFLSGVEQPPAS